jgi:hypothetical protein
MTQSQGEEMFVQAQEHILSPLAGESEGERENYFNKFGSNGYFPYFLTALAMAQTFSVLQ